MMITPILFIPKWLCRVLILLMLFLLPEWSRGQIPMRVAGFEIRVEGDFNGFDFNWKVQKIEENLEILIITLTSKSPTEPSPFSLKWSHPSHNVAGFWSTGAGFSKTVRADWSPSSVESMFARHAPVIALFGHDDQNCLNVAVSDALNRVKLSSGLREEDGRIYHQIDFFAEKHRAATMYKVEIRFDKRAIRYDEALQQLPDWWASFPGYQPAPVPEIAKMPMYSTWYSYHQKVSPKELLKEAEIARDLGFKAMIVDDGWQTMDSTRGYAFCGDWEPERMPDMKAFVQALHKMNMKILLWYAVPFMGENAKNFERFKGKYLRYWKGQGAYVMDPRYPEVRDYIIDIYKKAMMEWDLDGFKLDFIARFAADDDTDLEAVDGRDIASVNEAADQLMTDVLKELQKVNPEVMIEFRQPYVGPLMRKYGNLFRVGDCPNVGVRNRVGAVDLRLLSGETAVHSDMIMWHYNESVEIAALQFLNILFSVPQVSVRLGDIPKDHFNMVKYLTGYWNDNKSILMDGDFVAWNPLANYPMISGDTGNKRIIALYADIWISLSKADVRDAFDLVNAKTSRYFILDIQDDLGMYHCSIHDCQGQAQEHKNVDLKRGVSRIEVPASGIISFTRQNRLFQKD